MPEDKDNSWSNFFKDIIKTELMFAVLEWIFGIIDSIFGIINMIRRVLIIIFFVLATAAIVWKFFSTP